MKYQYQELSANDGQRQDMDNGAWETLFETDNLPDFFEWITEKLNDEEYPTNSWTRILIDGVPAECVSSRSGSTRRTDRQKSSTQKQEKINRRLLG